MKKTTLWHVGIVKRNNSFVVLASLEAAPDYVANSHMRFRAITGRAAARRFIRGNLKDILYKWHYGDWEVHQRFCGDDPTIVARYFNSLPEFIPIMIE